MIEVNKQGKGVMEEKTLSPAERILEVVMVGLRTSHGVLHEVFLQHSEGRKMEEVAINVDIFLRDVLLETISESVINFDVFL
jgi:coproporphyrinogen III oxidase-like Fe-S oxidoreductase